MGTLQVVPFEDETVTLSVAFIQATVERPAGPSGPFPVLGPALGQQVPRHLGADQRVLPIETGSTPFGCGGDREAFGLVNDVPGKGSAGGLWNVRPRCTGEAAHFRSVVRPGDGLPRDIRDQHSWVADAPMTHGYGPSVYTHTDPPRARQRFRLQMSERPTSQTNLVSPRSTP